MNTKFKILTFIILPVVILTSCQKVIELDLNTAAPAIVIQGNIYDQPGPYLVRISKTVNFNDSNVFPPVTDASVIIKDDEGNMDSLVELSDGNYVTSTLRGVEGRTYTLTVKEGGKTYNAVSTMPHAVRIDSIYFEKSSFGNFYLTNVNFSDPKDIDNYYRLFQSINDTTLSGINIQSDRLNQGEVIKYSFYPISQNGFDSFKKGDKITIKLECIDKGVYEYYRTSRRDNSQSASPANPTSNIGNGALGYFSACTIRQASITVP